MAANDAVVAASERRYIFCTTFSIYYEKCTALYLHMVDTNVCFLYESIYSIDAFILCKKFFSLKVTFLEQSEIFWFFWAMRHCN